ncbi:MAG: hypothetical protein APR63_03290 [Desulfuromonas sp. SDB]|nr:MAG: hypothetical protein APR63_03290 [Desulfuromonas sp. SDB]
MPNDQFSLIFIGDIIGQPGRETCHRLFDQIYEKYLPDIIVVNGENLASGFGISRKVANEMFSLGVNFITGGNHFLQVDNIEDWFEIEPKVVIPANYTHYIRGNRLGLYQSEQLKLYVISLLGRLYMNPVDNPFICIDKIISDIGNRDNNQIVVVDFHAEATSEKQAMLHHLNGRVSAVLGTHTHVQTADCLVTDQGTAYITDVGMVGAVKSVIGMDWKASVEIMKTGRRRRLRPYYDPLRKLDGVLVKFDKSTGGAALIENFSLRAEIN